MVWEGGRRVVSLLGVETVVQLAEEFVEEVALSADMTVATTSSLLVVASAR